MKYQSFRMGLALLVLTCIAASPATSAAPKRVPTHEDIRLVKRIGAPQVSPDGRWIVVSVMEPAYDENSQLSDLCLASSCSRKRITGY